MYMTETQSFKSNFISLVCVTLLIAYWVVSKMCYLSCSVAERTQTAAADIQCCFAYVVDVGCKCLSC